MQIEHEIIHRIHIGEYCLEVGTHPDFDKHVYIRALDEDTKECFGDVDLPLDPNAALALGNAMVNKAIELGAKQK